jgi:hypothetical protein
MLNLAPQHSRFGVDLCLRRALRSCGPDSILAPACEESLALVLMTQPRGEIWGFLLQACPFHMDLHKG